MLQQFPIEIGLGMDLQGAISRLEVFEETPTNVSHVIKATTTGSLGEPWGINLAWEISSDLPGNPHSGLLLDKIYNISVLLEGFGPGANEFSLPSAGPFNVNYGPPPPGGVFVNANTRTWEISIPFSPTADPIPPGLYKLGVVLTLVNPPPSSTPLAVAGFVEGPLVQFFELGP